MVVVACRLLLRMDRKENEHSSQAEDRSEHYQRGDTNSSKDLAEPMEDAIPARENLKERSSMTLTYLMLDFVKDLEIKLSHSDVRVASLVDETLAIKYLLETSLGRLCPIK